MAKKRKTLPKDFDEIIARGNLDEMKAVFEKCDINAYGSYNDGNALYFDDLSEDFILWAVAQGMDVNFEDKWGDPPITGQFRALNAIRLLLELGADINKQNKQHLTPLAYLVTTSLGTVEKVRFFVEHGADIHITNREKDYNILEITLMHCQNADISRVAEVANYLLSTGIKVNSMMKALVTKIGESFEQFRDSFNKDYLEETERGLQKLYELFDVEPVKKRNMHDGSSPITVSSKTWQAQFNELWDLLVPSSGNAPTVQGEVIRICGKVRREIIHNGAANWSREYKKLSQALPHYLSKGNELNEDDFKEAERLAKSIAANSDDEDFDKLAYYAVEWIKLNPKPISLGKVDYDR